MLGDDRQFIFGTARIAVARYKGYAVHSSRTAMKVFLRDPEETHGISGGDNVSAALLEIEHVLVPDEVGWVEAGD